MKILVGISVVPDTTTKIQFKENNTQFQTDGVQYIINPYDELALTRALELTEQHGGSVTVFTVGDATTEPVIRKALAIGAQDAVRVDIAPLDGLQVAENIASYAKNNSYDMVFVGRESIDYNGGQVAGLTAGLLDWPLLNIVTTCHIDGNIVSGKRDIDGGKQLVKANLPAVVSAQKDLVEPRIPNMRGIMQARTKPLNVIATVSAYDQTAYAAYELPEAKQGVRMIDAANAEELIDLLHTEKKLI